MAKGVVIGIDKTLKNLRKLGVDVENEIDSITEGTAREIQADAIIRAPNNFGGLQQSIISGQVDKGTYRVQVGADYGPYVEFGTGVKVQVPSEFLEMAARFKGGNGGSFEDGLKSIKDWCRSKGIPEDAAYPIFMSILKEGIRPQPFLYPAFVQGRIQYLKDLKAMLKRLVK